MKTNHEDKIVNTADGKQWHITEQDGLKAGLTLKNVDGSAGEWGHMWNVGIYHFRGKPVTLKEAQALLKFALTNGRCAETLNEAIF